MRESVTSAANLKLLGGRLCLDFANTADWHASDQPQEWLTSYAELVAWSHHAGALTGRGAQQLLPEAERRPAAANAVLERAIALREAIYRLFSALARGRPARRSDIAELGAGLGQALPRLRLVQTSGGFAWDWSADERALDRMLWPVARSAGDLLTSDTLSRVRECAGDPCGWLFLDTSRNRSRRWCAMEDCGNRAKARRYYRRRREVQA